jgi:multidrug efflux pump
MLVSGMIIGTLFTLFVVPSIYVLVARTHESEAKKQTEMDGLLPETAETVA